MEWMPGLVEDCVCDEDAEVNEESIDEPDRWGPSCRKRLKTNSGDVGRNKRNVKGRRGKLSALPYAHPHKTLSSLLINDLFACPTETCHSISCTRSVTGNRTNI